MRGPGHWLASCRGIPADTLITPSAGKSDHFECRIVLAVKAISLDTAPPRQKRLDFILDSHPRGERMALLHPSDSPAFAPSNQRPSYGNAGHSLSKPMITNSKLFLVADDSAAHRCLGGGRRIRLRDPGVSVGRRVPAGVRRRRLSLFDYRLDVAGSERSRLAAAIARRQPPSSGGDCLCPRGRFRGRRSDAVGSPMRSSKNPVRRKPCGAKWNKQSANTKPACGAK